MKTKLVENLTKVSVLNDTLFNLLERVVDSANFIEFVLVTLKNDDNKQKMIDWLKNNEVDKTRIFQKTVELNRGMKMF